MPESTQWRFAVVADPHLGGASDGLWNNRVICSRMPEVIECLREDLARLRPDFLLVLGDLVSDHTREAVLHARDLLDRLDVPYHVLGGNHDFFAAEGRTWFRGAFRMHMPAGDATYAIRHKGLRIVALDPWWQWPDGTLCPFAHPGRARSGWAVPPHQFGWLERELAADPRVPTLVAVHYPAVPIPRHLRRPGMRDAGRLANGRLLLSLLARHACVKAVLAGHVHLNAADVAAPVPHITTAALAEYPVEYREAVVHDGRLDLIAHPLSDPQYALSSLVPGGEWTAGTPLDRTVSIPLR